MTILIDIDGVIFNTQEALLSWLNIRYDTNYTIDDITSYDWFDKTFSNPWEIMNFDEFWNKVKVNKQEAIDYILKWKHEGHTIKFVTASYYHQSLPFKIHKLLDYFNGEFDDKDVIICHDKNMVKGDLLIDDFTNNCLEFDNCSILFSQPWNNVELIEDSPRILRLGEWKNIDGTIQYINDFIVKLWK